MRERYRTRTRIFWKILGIVLISIIFCVLVTSGFMYFYMKPLVENSLIEKRRDMVLNLSEQEVNTLEEISLYAMNITFDDTVQNIFKIEEPEDSYMFFAQIQTMEKKLKEYQMLYGGLIQDIFVIDGQGKVLEMVNTYRDLVGEEPYKEFMKNERISGFTPRYIFDYHGIIGEKNTIAYVNEIYDKNGIKVGLGKLVILLDTENMDAALMSDEELYLRLTTPEGVTVFDSLTGHEAMDPIYMDRIGETGWKVEYRIDNRALETVIRRMNSMVAVTIGLILLVMLSFMLLVLMRIISPLDTLIRGMQSVAQGSRTEHIEIHSQDECEEAADVFNKMVESIEKHTEQLVDSEKKQYEAQLKMLSYQLNPHFIYNTLNAIICLARKCSYEEIIDLTKAFIKLLQSLLRTDLQAMTTVEMEKEYIDNYLHVLQMCYRNVPDIVWQIQSGLEKREIPRMILYPLVENSVFHGIVPSDKTCFLHIAIKEKEGWISVSVEDNGIGCTQEELMEIRNRLESEKVENHIGLFNVNGRLRLIYKNSRPLIINSREGGGTIIQFSFYDRKI